MNILVIVLFVVASLFTLMAIALPNFRRLFNYAGAELWLATATLGCMSHSLTAVAFGFCLASLHISYLYHHGKEAA